MFVPGVDSWVVTECAMFRLVQGDYGCVQLFQCESVSQIECWMDFLSSVRLVLGFPDFVRNVVF